MEETSVLEMTKRLVGEKVMLMPYSRGYCPRDTLYRLWRMMDDEGLTKYVFHSATENGTPYPMGGDLVDFVKMFEPEHGKRFLLIVLDVTGEQLVGALWFDDIVGNHRASISIFMTEGYRGDAAEEAGRMALDYVFNQFCFMEIWAFTPWLHASRLAEKCGFVPIAVLPSLIPGKKETMDMRVLKITKEQFDGRLAF